MTELTSTVSIAAAPDQNALHRSPGRRIWQRFKRQKLGYWSLILFVLLYGLSLGAELICNDRPLLIYQNHQWFFPLWKDYTEQDLGGELPLGADYGDPEVQALIHRPGGFALQAPYRHHYATLTYFTEGAHHPGPPSALNWLGTDITGYDVGALMVYGFRISVTFALALTLSGTVLGVLIGAVQGYFAGKIDLVAQRLIEVWGAMPELYLLIVFASIFETNFALLFILLSLFGWVHLSDYVRAEFLRNRQLEYVKAARSLGLSSGQIIWRHILPNSLTPVITFLPFRVSAAITALASLDFLGLGVSSDTPSLGRLLLQGKSNLDAWWISLAAFSALMIAMLLLTFMGDALRHALDNRRSSQADLDAEADDSSDEAVAPTPRTATPQGLPASGLASTALLEIDQLSISFRRRCVVDGISLNIAAGERVALVGESGSGKTVTALSVLRLIRQAQVEGSIRLQGRELLNTTDDEIRQVRGGDVAMIFQEPMTALNPLYTIGNQIIETLVLHEGLSRAHARTKAIELLARTGIREPERRVDSYAHQLSGGQRQRAMIAMALACRPKLLIADEPTTALDLTIRERIVRLLLDLQREDAERNGGQGMAILLITHDLNLVRRFAQRVAVMERGHIVETGEAAALFAAPQHPYTIKLLNSIPRREIAPVPDDARTLLRTEGLCVDYPKKRIGWRGWFGSDTLRAVNQASLTLRAGETIGVVGESGSGKSTLALAVLGLVRTVAGTLEVDGVDQTRRSRAERRSLRARLQVVFQDPFGSLSPRQTVEQIVGEGLKLHFPQLSKAEHHQRIVGVLKEVGLSEQMLASYPHEFSGGQRQRIAIARALVLEPEILVLDEPTSALDVSIQQQVLQLLVALQRSHGLSYLLISHDLTVVRALSHRLYVMKDGDIVEQGDTEHVINHPQHPYTQSLVQASLPQAAQAGGSHGAGAAGAGADERLAPQALAA